jgi:hypothetical protein
MLMKGDNSGRCACCRHFPIDKGRIIAEREAHELQDREVAKRDLQI